MMFAHFCKIDLKFI